ASRGIRGSACAHGSPCTAERTARARPNQRRFGRPRPCYKGAVRRAPTAALIAGLSTALALPLAATADPPEDAPEREVPVRDLAALTKAAEASYPGIRAATARIRA